MTIAAHLLPGKYLILQCLTASVTLYFLDYVLLAPPTHTPLHLSARVGMKDELVSYELPSVRSREAPVFLYSSTLPTSSQETPKPMQFGRTRLTPDGRQRWRLANLCLYCGQATHFVSCCPAKDSVPLHCPLNHSSSCRVLTLCSLTLGPMPASWVKRQLGIYLVPLSRPILASVLDSYLLSTYPSDFASSCPAVQLLS